MEFPVGIDLGTGFCVVAVSRRNRVEVIANDATGSRSTPCIVGFSGGARYVGEAAKELPASYTVFEMKRLLGRGLDAEIEACIIRWPFAVSEEKGSLAIRVSGENQSFCPEEVTSFILDDMKRTAEGYLMGSVRKAVFTAPLHFRESQLEALKKSARLAGLEVLELVPEPQAAVLAYKLDKTDLDAVLVLHVGAGTCEASVVRVKAGKVTVRASRADLHLGGSALDGKLVEYVVKDMTSQCGFDVAADAQCMQDLREACQDARLRLSRATEVNISLSKGYKSKITRSQLEAMCADVFRKVLDLVGDVLEDVKMGEAAVDAVVLVGGTTRTPKLRSLLKQKLRKKEVHTSLNPEEVLAQGAALHAAALGGGSTTLREVELREEEERPQCSAAAAPAPALAPTDRRSEQEGPPVGIDLGTTFSVVAVHQKGRVLILCDEGGSRTVPSIVGFREGHRYVGHAAVDLPAKSKVFDAKRLIGRSFRDPEVQDDIKKWPFTVVDQLGAPRFQMQLDGKEEKFAPEEISGMVLSALKETAEAFLSCRIKKAVITVPAYFNETQRQATKDAGVIAGLDVIAMINEPTAACIAYGLINRSSQERVVLVYDLGGGTFDVSVMRVQGGEFRVLASGGNTHLGGQDFNNRLMDHFMQDIAARHPSLQLAGDPQAQQDLRAACELIKRKLSSVAEASASVYFPREDVSFKATASRALFEDLCKDLFQKTIDITDRVLKDANVNCTAVDEVVLVGGSTRIPKVRAMLQSFFGGKQLKHNINPDEAVAYGAAVHAAAMGGDRLVANQVVLRDVTSLSLGVATLGDIFDVVVPRNTQIPCKRTKSFHPAIDYQVEVVVEVFQGERQFAKDNHFLKCFHINIPKKPWSEVNLQVTFEIDGDGLLTVCCMETSTGETRKVNITQNEARLNEDEIQNMIKNAIRFKDRDQHQRERVQEMLRNNMML